MEREAETLPKGLPPVQYWAVTIAVMSASLIQFLDMTIANVAIPHMQASLNASSDTISWVLTSFIVATAVSIPSSGWIAARFGTRLPFLLALGGFIISSMLCGVATNLGSMVLFRVLQGIAAAFIAPLAQTILLDITPSAKHTRALSMWGMTAMLGPIVGPTLGGYLTDNLSWRWVFFINAPIGIPALLVLWRMLPNTTSAPRRLDKFGYAALALALAALQLLLDRGPANDWFDSVETWIEGIIALLAFTVFGIHSRYSLHPLFPEKLLQKRVLLAALLGCTLSFSMLGMSALLPTLLESQFGYSVTQVGEVMAPRGIGIFITMYFIPVFMERLPVRFILASGFAITALSLYGMSGWTTSAPTWLIGTTGFVQGLGMGLLMVPINFIAFSAVSADLRTDCAVFLNLVRNMAGSIAISCFILLISNLTQIMHSDLASSLSAINFNLGPDILRDVVHGSAPAIALIDAEVTRQAAFIAYLDVFYLAFLITLATIPLCLMVRGKVHSG
ncbi:MFS transporter, DHA2 family, multidrug resistance protein [Sphingobium faniae]|nr:MFS transporter, DHA2 family, multidrug resistance protein [Sphingobium faniae]